jgi:hypothetical protein
LQFFSTIAADSVAPGSATGESPKHADSRQAIGNIAARIKFANLTGAPPSVDTGSKPLVGRMFEAAPPSLAPPYGNFMASGVTAQPRRAEKAG